MLHNFSFLNIYITYSLTLLVMKKCLKFICETKLIERVHVSGQMFYDYSYGLVNVWSMFLHDVRFFLTNFSTLHLICRFGTMVCYYNYRPPQNYPSFCPIFKTALQKLYSVTVLRWNLLIITQ